MVSLILLDVNILVAAYRDDHAHHEKARRLLARLHDEGELLALCDVTLTGFLRIVTQAKIFPLPTLPAEAFEFIHRLLQLPTVVRIAPGPDHWKIFESTCLKNAATGSLITDVYLASLAFEHGCAVVTFDSDFDRFDGLRIVRPE